MTLVARLRRPVDTIAPSMGLLYRRLRDVTLWHIARPTRYGFALAGNHHATRADYEPEETDAFLELVASHDAVIDIGANVGLYSCLAASRRKQVLSFEPSARNLKFLCRNLWDNQFQNVEVFPLGLAKEPGLSRLYGFGGISSFVRGWADADERRFATVPVTSLDTVIADRFPGRKLLIKMDVEGFELDVLAGAERTLNRLPMPTWFVEILLIPERVQSDGSSSFAAAFETFWSRGYNCKKLNTTRDLVRPEDVRRWVSARRVEDGTRNFLFCKT